LRFIDFSARRKTTDHNGQANNTKEKTYWLYRSQGTKRGATQPHFDIRATGPPHISTGNPRSLSTALFSACGFFRNLIIGEGPLIDNLLDHFADVGSQ
jgi:hypothetical protein